MSLSDKIAYYTLGTKKKYRVRFLESPYTKAEKVYKYETIARSIEKAVDRTPRANKTYTQSKKMDAEGVPFEAEVTEKSPQYTSKKYKVTGKLRPCQFGLIFGPGLESGKTNILQSDHVKRKYKRMAKKREGFNVRDDKYLALRFDVSVRGNGYAAVPIWETSIDNIETM